jgi:molybdopterin-guanine dinucleotide biosynthesis protein A
MPTFSAALLLGGKSRRMGRDKALLPHPDGKLFWQHQLAVLENLNPSEILWSGSARPGLPSQVRIIEDAAKDAGPLGGLAACLRAMRTELLVVLAVDLAQVEGGFLRRLLDASAPGRGAVVRREGFYEPLAAVYPREAGDLALARLATGQLALQDWLREAEAAGMMRVVSCSEAESAQLRNFNEPEDLNSPL